MARTLTLRSGWMPPLDQQKEWHPSEICRWCVHDTRLALPKTGEGQRPTNLLEMAGRKRALTRQLLGAVRRLASSLVATAAGVQPAVRRSRLKVGTSHRSTMEWYGVLGTLTSWTCTP